MSNNEEESPIESDFDVYSETSPEASPEVSPVENMLMINEPVEEILEHNKRWLRYARRKLYGTPQDSRLISNFHVDILGIVKVWMLFKNTILIVRAEEEGQYRAVVVKNRNPSVTRVFEFGDPEETEFQIEFDEIVTEMEELKKAMTEQITPKYGVTGREAHFYIVDQFKEASTVTEWPVYQCVQVGQYFELQLAESPQYVVLAKVEKNIKGMLLASFANEKRWVHMRDGLVHEVGWNRKQFYDYGQNGQQTIYVPGHGRDICAAALANKVPDFAFRYNYTNLHRLRSGDMVAVTDVRHRGFWYAHVVEDTLNSDHYFFLSTGEDMHRDQNGRPTHFHVYSPRIFPIEAIKKSGIQLRLPRDLTVRVNESDLDAYRRIYAPSGRLLGSYIGLSPDFWRYALSQHTKNRTRRQLYDSMKETLRYVEIFRPTKTGGVQLTAGVITGNREHILRIVTADEETPFYMHYNDLRIFHLGTCIDSELAVSFDIEKLERHARLVQQRRSFGAF